MLGDYDWLEYGLERLEFKGLRLVLKVSVLIWLDASGIDAVELGCDF